MEDKTMTKNEKIYMINGIIYGLKTSIKLFSRLKDIKKSINVLCNLQKELLSIENIDNIENTDIWQICENINMKNNFAVTLTKIIS